MALTTSALLGEIKDDSWIRQAMFVPKPYLASGRKQVREYSEASTKYVDTSPGGHHAINPLPQFNAVTDPRIVGLASQSLGLGAFYSEAYDDPQVRISLQFGVPTFNSMFSFLANFYNPQLGSLVNRGESTGISYSGGYALGFLLTLPLQAVFGVAALTKRITSALTGNPYSKFYYMQPTMDLYWNTVQNIFNVLAVNMGVIGSAFTDSKGNNAELSDADVGIIQRSLPDIFKLSADGKRINGIDVFAIATRSQRLADQYHRRLEAAAKGSPDQYVAKVKEILRQESMNPYDAQKKIPGYGKYVNGFLQQAESVRTEPPKDSKEDPAYYQRKVNKLKDSWIAELRDGSAFVNFAVSVPEPSESFSNSVKEAPIAEKFNGASAAMRDLRFSMADGNIVGDIQKTVTGALTSFLAGAADSVGLGGVFNSLAGEALADIPKVWDNSSAELTTNSYRLRLVSPYGNKLSVALDVLLPLSMLLAGALPRSTGKQSYSSPFLCRLFSQGVTDVKLGMITSLNIRRGTNNIKWTADNLTNAIDVDFTVTNLDNLIHIPVMDSLTSGGIFRFFDEDSAFTDYMGALSGMSLFDTYYAAPRFKLAWAKTMANKSSAFTPAALANWAAGTTPGRILSLIARDGEL